MGTCRDCGGPTKHGESVCDSWTCFQTWSAHRDATKLALHSAFPSLPARLVNCLSGLLRTPEEVAAMTDAEVLSLNYVGTGLLQQFRAAVSPAVPVTCNWVGEAVPEMAGG